MSSLGEALPAEIDRNIDLVVEYSRIQQGTMVAAGIRLQIAAALKALAEQDVLAMIDVYQRLKAND